MTRLSKTATLFGNRLGTGLVLFVVGHLIAAVAMAENNPRGAQVSRAPEDIEAGVEPAPGPRSPFTTEDRFQWALLSIQRGNARRAAAEFGAARDAVQAERTRAKGKAEQDLRVAGQNLDAFAGRLLNGDTVSEEEATALFARTHAALARQFWDKSDPTSKKPMDYIRGHFLQAALRHIALAYDWADSPPEVTPTAALRDLRSRLDRLIAENGEAKDAFETLRQAVLTQVETIERSLQ